MFETFHVGSILALTVVAFLITIVVFRSSRRDVTAAGGAKK